MRRLVLCALLLVPVAVSGEEKRLPLGPPGTVSLPLAEYERLLDRAAKPPKRPEPPPIPAVVARADVRLRVAGESVRGTVALDGEVFRAGFAKVPLLSGGTLLDARLAGRPLPLMLDGGMHAAILGGPGPFSVALDWGAAVAMEPGRASFVLPASSAESARATIEVPGEQADMHVEPGLVTRRTAAGGRTIVEAALAPHSATRFWWSTREGPTPVTREARFLSNVLTLVTVGEADLRMAVLADVTLVQGAPARFALRVPAGFTVTGASGSSLERAEDEPGGLALVVRGGAPSRQQFLVSLERASAGGSFRDEVPLPSVTGAQRETGEAALEGTGTMELTATEGDGMHRMDVREASDALKGLARQPLLAAFRYHRGAGDAPRLALDVKRFPDAAVLAAVAERAVVTTLVTTEGRTLTEVSLSVRNHAQPFLKVALPEGATLLSAEVAGEGVKPVKGDDGTRVPLLRAGFRPDGPYAVSFVYLLPGTAFGKKGEARLGLPRMDVPVSLLEWELFVPDRYKVADFGGNALPWPAGPVGAGVGGDFPASGLVGALQETVTVNAEAPMVDKSSAVTTIPGAQLSVPARDHARGKPKQEAAQNEPSANVFRLQRRVAGVLPVRVDVPRAGASYRFVRPLVLDEETSVRFSYKAR